MSNPAPGFSEHPGHRVELSEADHAVEVSLAGEIIADTRRAILLQEDGYPGRYYLPKADVDMQKLSASTHTTQCPFKGGARYWNVAAGDSVAENGAWGYDSPYDECAALAGYVAFYGERFDIKHGTG